MGCRRAIMLIMLYIVGPPAISAQGKHDYRPIVVIGWDGADWAILEPLLAAGRLPALERLMNRGRSGWLRSTPCFVSPPAWVSIYTGKNPGKTDIFHFGRRESDLPHLGDLSGHDVRAKRIWEVMSEAGRRCAVVNVPLTYPASPLNGIVISGEFAPCVLERPRLFEISRWDTLWGRDGVRRSATISLHGTLVGVTIDAENAAAPALTITNQASGDTMVGPCLPLGEWSEWFLLRISDYTTGWAKISLRGFDPQKTRLWLSHVYRPIEEMPAPITYPPEWADTLAANHGRFLPFVRWNWKPAMDHVEWLGELCKDVLLRDRWDLYTCVFLAPDHMQHLYGDGEQTARVLEELDRVTGEIVALAPENALILLVSDHGFASYQRRVDVNAWLHDNRLAKFAPTGEVMPDSSLAWSTMWSIYLNERLLNKDERERVIDMLLSRAPELRDHELDDVLIGLSLHRREDIYRGPYMERAPHLVVVPSATPYVPEFWDTKNVGPDGTRQLCRNTKPHDAWDHAIDGIFIVDGPGIEHSPERLWASVYDIVPTLMAYAGLPVADDLDGRVLSELFEPHGLSGMARCETYENGTVVPDDQIERGSLEERLRVLGYVE